MPWTNYHSHSHYCDGKGQLEDYVTEAINQNMPAYGFSTHGPVPFESAWNMQAAAVPAYRQEFEEVRKKYEGKIELYLGMEVDYVPDNQTGAINQNAPAIRDAQLDYTIGSIHFTGHLANGRPCEIDGPHNIFLEGLRETDQGNVERFVSRYFELTRMMVETACPDVVGHLDKIKMQHEDGQLFHEGLEWYRKEVQQTLEVIAQYKPIVEVNTRGIYKKKTAETYPSPWVLHALRDFKVPIMLNSDSHHPKEISLQFGETAEMLRSLGFQELMVLQGGQWVPKPFDENGYLA